MSLTAISEGVRKQKVCQKKQTSVLVGVRESEASVNPEVLRQIRTLTVTSLWHD